MDMTADSTTTPPGPGHGDIPARPYPLLVQLDGAHCLVVGAGPVAARKASGLLDAGAEVTLVAPHIGPEVRSLGSSDDPRAGSLTVEQRPYRSPEASTYRIVISASGDPDVDARVADDALAGGALVNRADTSTAADARAGRAAGNIVLPAVHRVGPVTLAVSTDGSSPALARWLRDRAAASLGPDIAILAGLVDDARRDLLAAGRTPGSIDWADVLDKVAPLVAGGSVSEARVLLAGLTRPDPGATALSPLFGK